MSTISVIILAAVISLGVFVAPRDALGRRPLFSAYVITMLCFALYLLLPSVLLLMSGKFVWAAAYFSEEAVASAVGLSILGVVAFLIGNTLVRARAADRPGLSFQPTSRSNASHRAPLWIAGLLVVVGLGLKMYLIVSSGGIDDALVRMSGGLRAQTGIDVLDPAANAIRTISGIADGAAIWGLIAAIRSRKGQAAWAIILALVLALSYLTSGKRLFLILPIIAIGVAIHYLRRPLTTRLIPFALLGIVALGFATLLFRVILPLGVLGRALDLNEAEYANGSIFDFYLYSLEFSSVEMIAVSVAAGPQIAALFGGPWEAFVTTNLSPFLYSVPRAIWVDKPDVFLDISHGVSAVLGYGYIEDPTVGINPTLIGTAYILAGTAGVGIAMFLLGILVGLIDRWQARTSHTTGSVVAYSISIVIVFHLFRQGTLGWTFIITIIQQYGLLLAFVALSLSTLLLQHSVAGDRAQIEPVAR